MFFRHHLLYTASDESFDIDRALRSYRTIEYFRFVHTELTNQIEFLFLILFFLVALRSAHVPRVNGKAKRANFNRSEIRPEPCEQFHSLNSNNNDLAIERDFLWL